jgi:Calcineurin-like phosphoesterase
MPRVPDGIRIYAIGDVHGRADLLERKLSSIDTHLTFHSTSRAIEVLVGDYVDRGPGSRQVLDLLIRRRRSHELICLKGNHESYVFQFLRDPTVLRDWRQYGGLETLVSYGLKPPLNPSSAEQIELSKAFAEMLPHDHKVFLSQLPLSFTCGDFFFVHAGVKPGVPLPRQAEEDMLWIRDDFLVCEDDFAKIVVHGHTPVIEPDIRLNRINIDTGAYATGKLTCIAIEKERFTLI